MKVFYRDYLKQPEIIQDYKFPKKPFKPKVLPTKGELKIFYDALQDKHKVHFLMLASSGLRVSELLNADINKNKRMLIPQLHEGNTKRSWVSFYNEEAGALLKDEIPSITIDGLNHALKKYPIKQAFIFILICLGRPLQFVLVNLIKPQINTDFQAAYPRLSAFICG